MSRKCYLVNKKRDFCHCAAAALLLVDNLAFVESLSGGGFSRGGSSVLFPYGGHWGCGCSEGGEGRRAVESRDRDHKLSKLCYLKQHHMESLVSNPRIHSFCCFDNIDDIVLICHFCWKFYLVDIVSCSFCLLWKYSILQFAF